MQSSERNTRSTRKFVSDQMASPTPESQSDTGQYLCIECNETFDSRHELNSHRQSHVTKKQFACAHCGRGFHHQVFLQMHERSHEGEGSTVKTPPSRVISTRSSKMADIVHVKPTYTKPQRLLNTIVEFKNEPKVCQTFTPREFVTRRSHSTSSSVSQKDIPERNNLFELRISKLSDTTVHLMDAFGNSIEILADVFNTYTIGEVEGKGGRFDEARTKTAGEVSSQRLSEEPSPSSQTEPIELAPLDSEMDSDLPPSHESAESSESPASEKLDTEDADLPVPERSNLEFLTEPVSDDEDLQPSIVAQETTSLAGDSTVTDSLPVYADARMKTPPAEAAGLQEVAYVPGTVCEVDLSVGSKDLPDKPVLETASIAAPPVELPSQSEAQPLLDYPGPLKDMAPETPETLETNEESKQVDEITDSKLKEDSTLLKPDAEIEQVPRMEAEGDLPSALSPYSSALESRVPEQPGKEDSDLSNTLSINGDDKSIDERSDEEHVDAELTLQASEEDSNRIGVEVVLPEKHDLHSVSMKEKSIHLDTDVCMSPQDVREDSVSEGGVSSSELNLQGGSKEAEKPCTLLAGEDDLPDDELVIDDKRDEDLFERDIFPLEAPMEACEKGIDSIEEEQNLVCAGGAHTTKIVPSKDNDICLNGSDMTYISESEMIKLLEQDKDDITDDEPITTCQKDLENTGPSQKETELSSTRDTKSSSSPLIWNGEPNTDNGTSELVASLEEEVQNYQAKSKTNDHVSLTSEIQVSNEVSTFQAPSEEMNTDSCLNESFLSTDEVSEPQNDLEQPEQGVSLEDRNYELCESSSGIQDVSPDLVSKTKHIPEQDSNVLVTEEDNDGSDSSVQKIAPLESSSVKEAAVESVHLVSASEPAQTTTLECVNENLITPQKEAEPNTETKEKICSLEKQEVEKPTLDVLEYMQSPICKDTQKKAASTESTGLKIVNEDSTNLLKEDEKSIEGNDEADTQEQTTDLSADVDQNKPKENDPKRSLTTSPNKLGELSTADIDLGGLEDISIQKGAEESLEKDDASPKTIHENRVAEVVKDDSSTTKQKSDVIQDIVEESELIENDKHDAETPTKAMGAGGSCLKCGRKLRRSRKELVWHPSCFKCRKAAKKQERLSAHEISDDLDLSIAPVFKSEESFSAELSDSHNKHDDDDLPHVSEKSDGSAAGKIYKCPKCDKAFKIPALLAGHIKCHTLPQCVSCGCQMQLKYKSKRIPRRCQKCVKQLKRKRADKKVGEGSGDEDSGTSDEEVADALAVINPDEDASDGESLVAVPKAKRKALKAKAGSRVPIEQIHDDVLLPGESPESDADDEAVDSLKKGKAKSKRQDIDSSDELDTSDPNLVLSDGEKPRLCPQCGKAFQCNRSMNLHLLSHSGVQCESCGCRLPKKRRVGRWSRKCRSCRLQMKDGLSNEGEDETDPSPSSNKSLKQKNPASLRLKAKQTKITKNTKLQSMIKKKKELKWMNMLLAVKGLMDKSRKKKESALKAVDDTKKDGESSEAEKCDEPSVDDSSILPDDPDTQTAGSSTLEIPPDDTPSGSPNAGRKSLHKEKNIIKMEENEMLPFDSTAFIKTEESWQCLECNQSWPNSEALVNHQHSHVSEQSFTCPQCPQVFSSEQYLDIHIHAHDEERPFRCPECDKTFTKRNHLGVHMRVHTGSRPFACPDCPCRFRQKVTLIAHRYCHRNYQLMFTKPFQCSVCSKSFKQKERLVVHERLHTGECPFSCKDCDEVFPSKARLYVHRKMHKVCEDSTSSEQVLSKSDEVDGEPFKCQDCGKVCSTKASFVLHRKIHSLSTIPVKSIKREQNEENQPFTCTECNKVFSSKATLNMHLKNHSAHKSSTKSETDLEYKKCFPCKICEKVCFSKASLALHRKIHKSPSDGEQSFLIKVEDEVPSYICIDCDKVCSTKASLALHRKVHKTPTDGETFSFKCKVCDMVCTSKTSFMLHKKVHKSSTKQKPKGGGEPKSFSCKHCDMVFSTKSSYVLHNKVHKSPSISEENLKDDEELQSYNCKHCDMVFTTKASFILHSKVHRPSTGEEEESLKVEEEPQTYNCKHCDMVCSTKASFAVHSKVHRSLLTNEQSPKTSEELQAYGCKHCDIVCSTNASFALHSKVHRSLVSEQTPKTTPEEPQSYNCKECETEFSTKISFILHLKIPKSGVDTEDKTFACKECNKVCFSKASLMHHRKVHKPTSTEGDGAETTFQCKDCNKIFTTKGRLAAHRRLHDTSPSREQNSDNESSADQSKKTNEEKPFPCMICGLRFAKLKMLVRHKAVHGVRTVTPCTHCGKRFLYMKSLFNHIKTCQSKNKGKKSLKKAAVKRKIPKDGGSSTASDGETVQKKRKTDEKPKALTAAQKLKNKKQMVKAKKSGVGKEKGKGKAAGESKTKEKRTKADSEAGSESEGKKTTSESDEKPEKPSEETAKEPTVKKNVPKIKKVKKDPAKNKKVAAGVQKKWRVLAASTVKKKAVLIGGKKKLLVKKKVQLKAKPGGKAAKEGGKAAKEGGKTGKEGGKASKEGGKTSKDGGKASKDGAKANKEGGKANKEGGKANKEGGKANKEGGKASKEGGKANKEGGKANKEGGKANKEGGKANKEGGKASKEGGKANKEGGRANKEGGKASKDGGKASKD